MDKAIVALIMAVANLVDIFAGENWWSHLKEEEIGVVVNVLGPIWVWLVPNGWIGRTITGA